MRRPDRLHGWRRPAGGRIGAQVGLAVAMLLLTGCEQDMYDQPKYKTYSEAADFPNGQSALAPVAGTIARGAAWQPRPETSPLPLTAALLARGRERFDIYCSPCHGRLGDGEGMVVQRGFPQPPSYHSERLRKAPDAHFYDVISNGFGVMYSYAARVAPDDRWAIVAYIRALQLSQNASQQDLREIRSSAEEAPHAAP